MGPDVVGLPAKTLTAGYFLLVDPCGVLVRCQVALASSHLSHEGRMPGIRGIRGPRTNTQYIRGSCDQCDVISAQGLS